MAGALDGIRVIDFGQRLAGPLTALLLADQGAEVIHVDPPGGPAWKTVANATLQRGKQRIVLDLKSPAELVSARGLINSADVVIENCRPGVMAHGLSVTRRHRDGAMITTIGPPAWLSRTPVVPGCPVSPPGGDAVEVLSMIGMADKLDELVQKRVIALD